MNLKDAFRCQNKIKDLMEKAEQILGLAENVTKVKTTFFRKKAMPGAEDETFEEQPTTEYADRITDMVRCVIFLLDEREKLARAIRTAKNQLPVDIDAESSLNGERQEAAKLLKRMADLRSSERVSVAGGTGYTFNQEGNQVTYRCDIKRVTTINFDRNVVRQYITALNKKSDAVSAELDKCLINKEVDYKPPFDVNDTFNEIFLSFAEGTH